MRTQQAACSKRSTHIPASRRASFTVSSSLPARCSLRASRLQLPGMRMAEGGSDGLATADLVIGISPVPAKKAAGHAESVVQGKDIGNEYMGD